MAVNISKMGFKGYLLKGGRGGAPPPLPASIMSSPCPGIRSKRRVVASNNSNPPLQNPGVPSHIYPFGGTQILGLGGEAWGVLSEGGGGFK